MRKLNKIISYVVIFGLVFSVGVIPASINATAMWTPAEELVLEKGTPSSDGYSKATLSDFGLLTDNFDHLTPVENAAAVSHYSNIDENGFKFLDEYKYMTGETFKIVSGENADGTQSSMLEVTPSTSNLSFRRYCTIPEDKQGYFKYDIKFTTLPDDNENFSSTLEFGLGYLNSSSVAVGYDSSTKKAYFCQYDSSNFTTRPSDAVDIVKDKWYTFVYRITESSGATTWTIDSAVYDAQTGAEVYKLEGKKNWEALFSMFCTGISTQGDLQFLIDNMEFYVDESSSSPLITNVSIKDEASDMARNVPITAYFSEKVTGDLLLYKEISEGSYELVTTTSSPLGFNGLKLEYYGLLDKNTKYKLSMENIVDSDSNTCVTQEIIFTTESMHQWNEVDIQSVTTTGEGSEAITQISFTIANPFGYEVFAGAVMAAWYSGAEMKGLGTIIKQFTAGSTVSEAFSFGGVPQSRDTIQLMQFDASGSLIPLSSGMITVE